jgi:hypothetical protein
LVIIMVYHVRDRLASPDNRRTAMYYAASFYFTSWWLGGALFLGLPLLYSAAGFGGEKNMILVAAAVSIHHFVVDGFIWRSRKSRGKSNAQQAVVDV